MAAYIKDEFGTGSGSVDSKHAEDWRKMAREISGLDTDDSESPHSVWSDGTISPEAIARGTITAGKIMSGRFTKDSATEESVPYIEKVRRTAEASDLIEKYKLYEDKRMTTKKTKPTAPAETFSPEYNFVVEPESDRPNRDDPNTGYVIVDGLDGPINNYKP